MQEESVVKDVPSHQFADGLQPKGLILQSYVVFGSNVSKNKESTVSNEGVCITFGSVPFQLEVEPLTRHFTLNEAALGAFQLSVTSDEEIFETAKLAGSHCENAN